MTSGLLISTITPWLGSVCQVEDKGNVNQHRRRSRQSIVNDKLVALGLYHLALGHTQLLQELELTLIPLCITELLNRQNGSGGHGQRQSQIEQGEHTGRSGRPPLLPHLPGW